MENKCILMQLAGFNFYVAHFFKKLTTVPSTPTGKLLCLICQCPKTTNPLPSPPLPHVVYLDQRTGAPHAICWLKFFF